MKIRRLRTLIPVAVIAVVGIAYAAHLDVGTLSAGGWSVISLICPLGALSTLVASKTLVPHVVVVLAIGLALMALLGRVFCGWICPVPLVSKLRDLLSARKGEISTRKDDAAPDGSKAADKGNLSEGAAFELAADASADGVRSCAEGDHEEDESLDADKRADDARRAHVGCATCSSCADKRRAVLDSRHIVLGGSVLAAAVFGFPVFCLVCPIGLTFATVFLLINLFSAGDVTWTVLLAPAVLLAEVVFFRKWCSTFCPLGALASLLGHAAPLFRPRVDHSACLESGAGRTCGVCVETCPEGIDPRKAALPNHGGNECTRCHVCAERCPAHAITLPVLAAPSRKTSAQDSLPAEELQEVTKAPKTKE